MRRAWPGRSSGSTGPRAERGSPFGAAVAVAFLALAVLFPFFGGGVVMSLAGFAGFGIVALFLAVNAIADARRMADPLVAEVGPDGIRLPGVGRIGWDEIATSVSSR